MYLARFSVPEGEIVSAAFKWPIPDADLVPRGWRRALLAEERFDIGLRVVRQAVDSHALLLLIADGNDEKALQARCEALLATERPAGLALPVASGDFDAFAACLPQGQLRVDHTGFHHHGRDVASDFRLYAMIAGQRSSGPATYQINLRATRADAELQRRVRKHVAWLDLEQPFSEPVRAMQRSLAMRLLNNGWLADEYLAVDPDELPHWQEKIREHFDETLGRIGFPEPPLVAGDFSDWMITGRHSSRDPGGSESLASQAASVFSGEECDLLFSSNFGPRDARSPAARANGRIDVFISYSSANSAHANEVCRFLETNGMACWIAPRDIDHDLLPYTEAIPRGLAAARAVVVLISDTANQSVHIPRELDIALERKLAIVPMRLQDVMPAGQLAYLLRTCQWLNAYNRDFRESLAELLARLRKLAS